MAKPPAKTPSSIRKVICENRRARHNYAIEETMEAGLVLVGTEVKALREGKAHLNDAYVNVVRGEAHLMGGHVAEYSYGNQFNHAPTRSRKLLLKRREIVKLSEKLTLKGYSAVPLRMYFNEKNRVKIEIGVGRGKNVYDKRVDIKDREAQREIARVMRQRNKAR